MLAKILFTICFMLINACFGQVVLFGTCHQVETVRYFDIERFLGNWYELDRFSSWYENEGQCARKIFQLCGRRLEIAHMYVRDGVQFKLHVNSTYAPGDEAVFDIERSNIDPLGISLSVISTDYTKYALVYGCRNNPNLGIKYVSAWILSREQSLPYDIWMKARQELNTIPYASTAYFQTVLQDEESCEHMWTAHVYEILTDNDNLE